MKFAIIKERKNPPDKRAVLSPEACAAFKKIFQKAEIKVESDSNRAFSDEEYLKLGIEVTHDISDCDVMLGIKEVPADYLIPNKKYFFFSHTIKKQPHNQKLLQAILQKNIELYDHEVITDTKGIRIVAFGKYAGIVGAYDTIRAYGLKMRSFNLPKAQDLPDKQALIEVLRKVTLPNIKIVLTGKGRVGNSVKEMLDAMPVREVTVDDYLTKVYDEAVYTQIDVLDYNKRIDGQVLPESDFFQNAQDYKSTFMRFAKVSDVYIAGHFYGAGAPYLYTREDAKDPSFKIRVVGDISCDVGGPVASTLRSSTIADPIYGYDPQTEKETDYLNENAIAVMAVDTLPCELPRDSSIGFGECFLTQVLPAFFDGDKDSILARALMTKNGSLTERFAYLQDYAKG
ncbi:MAG: NAD(P)-dependent oxidoreductase [Flavobacteriaceae bacterium]|nr:NAD(P)-dependent oxidoreductase [Flavobacteriaceae bacterium]